jgi:hypothetical protein
MVVLNSPPLAPARRSSALWLLEAYALQIDLRDQGQLGEVNEGPLDARDSGAFALCLKNSPVHIEEFLGVSARGVDSSLPQVGRAGKAFDSKGHTELLATCSASNRAMATNRCSATVPLRQAESICGVLDVC